MKQMPLCPVCGTRLVYPDNPKRRHRWLGGSQANTGPLCVLSNVQCKKCPTTCDVDEELMFVRAFTPHQPLKVKVAQQH